MVENGRPQKFWGKVGQIHAQREEERAMVQRQLEEYLREHPEMDDVEQDWDEDCDEEED